MIKNIILDMGNVCCRWDVDYIAESLTNQPAMQELIKKRIFLSKQWQLLDAGKISFQQAQMEMSKHLSDDEKEMIHYALWHWYDYFDQYDIMEKYIAKWKEKGYSIFLLSNCSLQFYDYFQKKSIFTHFDGYYISAKHQLLKPNKEIYQDFLKQYQLKAEDCLFVDDVEDNVIGAIAVGMRAIVYRGNPDSIDKMLIL